MQDNKITDLRIIETSLDEILVMMTIAIINFLFVELLVLQKTLVFWPNDV